MTSANRSGKNGSIRKFVGRVVRYLLRFLAAHTGPSVHTVRDESTLDFLNRFDFAASSGSFDPLGYDATQVLLDHFAVRIESHWPDTPSILTDLRIDLSRMTDQEIIARANRALEYDLHPSGVRPKITGRGTLDWATNQSKSREWLLMIHRHAWWILWAAAYQRTGDEKFTKAFVAQMTDWIDQNPVPRKRSEHRNSKCSAPSMIMASS